MLTWLTSLSKQTCMHPAMAWHTGARARSITWQVSCGQEKKTHMTRPQPGGVRTWTAARVGGSQLTPCVACSFITEPRDHRLIKGSDVMRTLIVSAWFGNFFPPHMGLLAVPRSRSMETHVVDRSPICPLYANSFCCGFQAGRGNDPVLDQHVLLGGGAGRVNDQTHL